MTMVIMTEMMKNGNDTRHNFYRRNAQSSIQAESWKPWESVPPGLPDDDHYDGFVGQKNANLLYQSFCPAILRHMYQKK